MNILIADDDRICLALLRRNLEEWGYSVTAVEDGDQAWAAFQQDGCPHLAILDWQMPGMDGLSLCSALKKQKWDNPLYLIVLTARNGMKDRVTCLEAGADDYIVKPYDPAELRARVNVGRNILNMQTELREKEKLQGAMEMAGAVCHELNQPLQVVLGFTELLLMHTNPADPRYANVDSLKAGVERIGELTNKIMRLTTYRSKSYLGRTNIVDLDLSSGADRLNQ